MALTPRQQRLLMFLNVARKIRAVRWGFGAVLLSNTLLLFVLILTEHLRWIHAPWTPSVTRALFQTFLATSLFNTALFGTASVGSAIFLYRRRREDARADPMTLVRRAFVTPLLYVLSVFWGWAWLAGHSPRIFGAALAAVWVGSQIAHTLYFTVRGFRKASATDQSDGQSEGRGRRLARAIQVRLAARARRRAYDFRRRWWSLTHRDYIKRLPTPDQTLFQSVVRGVTQNVEVLLKRGADPNLRLLYGMPMIAFCASLGRNEAVRALLDAGADIDAATPSLGFTALLNAAGKGNLALAHLLIGRGADIEARISSGETPLMLAARDGHAEVVAFLLESGARSDATNAKGVTALIFASSFGHVDVARTLLDAGADPSSRTISGRTALGYAKKKGHLELVEVLSQAQNGSGRSEVVL